MDPRQAKLAAAESVLANLYAPIEKTMAELNDFLSNEFASGQPSLHMLLQHVARFRGKQIRPACLFLAGRYFGELSKDHVKCAASIEMIHTATLVHDDLLDDAQVRRHVETVNQIWGERAAILMGDFVYSRGFTISTEVEGAAPLVSATTHTICEGELLQNTNAFKVELPEETYKEVIFKKTAVLYGLSCKLGAALSGATQEQQDLFEGFGNNIGMAFQIADDALDLVGDQHVVGKSLGTDLKKGKMTLPLIRLRECLGSGRLEEYLWLLARPNELGTQQRVLNLLQATDVLDQVHDEAARYVSLAIDCLNKLPDHELRAPLENLARFIVIRDH